MGFAAGVMIAASVWSLLIPAIEMGEEQGFPGWLPAGVGFAFGGIFLLLLDKLLPHLHAATNEIEGIPTKLKRTTLLVIAVTLHNIPEGLAVGLAFGLAAKDGNPSSLSAAMALAIGIGLQNFPEGAAISLPIKNEGSSKFKSFVYGSLSGIVEPVAGIIGAILVGTVTVIMPWALAFTAGAMIYVVAEELIPESKIAENTHAGTIGVMFGFLIMMTLDVALG